MNGFSLQVPRIIFGPGKAAILPAQIAARGTKVLLVTGARSLDSSPAGKKLIRLLEESALDVVRYPVSGEPSPETVDRAAERYRGTGIQVVAAAGGGSVLDAGKAIAAMLTETGSVEDYLEGVGHKKPSGSKLPCIALPTTAGTGSEATKNAVISRVGAQGYKHSLRHDNYIPDLALVDPELALGCPGEVTAASGMDALTQLVESYVSVKANPFTDALAISGLEQAAACLIPACTGQGGDIALRSGLAYAALVSGITLAHAGLGMVHGLAAALGGMAPVPHGAACAALVGPVTEATIKKLQSEQGTATDGLIKYAKAGYILSQNPGADIEQGCDLLIGTLKAWARELNLKSLQDLGITPALHDRIVKNTSAKNNPGTWTQPEIRGILET